jgi:UDP:flavonoid glycosyltransferase YjiC (YdhE family)
MVPVSKAKIVLTTFGSLGDLHPYLALGRGLLERGHSVVLATLESHRHRVEEAGLLFHAMAPDIADFGDESAFMAQVMDQKRGLEFVICGLVMPHLKRSYQELSTVAADADILVTHPLTYAAQLFAEKHAQEMIWVSVALAPSSFWSAYDPPVMAPLPWLARLRPLGPRFFRPVMGLLEKSLGHWVKPWHAFREELRLPATKGNPLFEAQFSPSLSLGMFSPLIASRQPDWPPNARATGFAFYDGTQGSEVPEDLASFLQNGDPPLVFTLGSSAVMDAGDFYTESAKAAKLLGKRAVLLVGRDPRNRPKESLPNDVIACEYAPYLTVFPHGAVIVHQGGIGTTAECMRAGKPMLIMPFGFDQFDNAARVEGLGIARTVSRKAYTAEGAARELGILLNTPAYRSRANEVSKTIAREDGVGNACLEIESQLQRRACS